MPENDGFFPVARARRWPSVVVALVVAFSLSLTGFLFLRDRQNAEAATGSRTNAAQDAAALATLAIFARTINLDASLRRAGVVGLRSIAQREFESLIVAPLGGALEFGAHQWSLALDGGWACLIWLQGARTGMVVARLGVCTDNAPLVASPTLTPRQFTGAEQLVVREHRAALYAAEVAAAISSTAQGYNPRFSLPALTTRFARIVHVPFRSWATATGITVATASSAACLQPTVTDAQVRVLLGPCS